jgi:hypothetical protein
MEKPGGPPGYQLPMPRWLGRSGQDELSGKWYSNRQPWPEQHRPLDRPTSTWGKKRNWVISNKNNKDTLQRECGILSTEEGVRGILPGAVNKQARPGLRGSGGSGGMRPATRSRKVCENGGGRKTPQERREDALPMWAVNKHTGQRKPVLGKGKACSSGSCTGELWVNKACGARWLLSSPQRDLHK